jgi:predicted  nucleic acid-binding Zn-ribbon protein
LNTLATVEETPIWGGPKNREQSKSQLKRVGANNLEAMRSECGRIEAIVHAASEELAESSSVADPAQRVKGLRERLSDLEAKGRELETAVGVAVSKIVSKPTGCRAVAGEALGKLAAAEATVRASREELDRLPPPAELAAKLDEAERDLVDAQTALSRAQLTVEEDALPGRLDAANDGLKQLQKRHDEVGEELHKLQGSLSKSAGLHQERAEAAAVVDGLKRKTERDVLESRAYDRLYELFEECRQRQLTTVAGPVTDRVIRWMRLAGISDYEAMECGDNFLPHTLTGRDGRQSLPLDLESTGTQEQVALMVRLALGSVIAPPGESAVAVLDDPLTHSDSLRLDRMRAVLKAAAGDPSTTPSIGPIQILVFTCHPEWFRVGSGPMIDLGDPSVLHRA